MKDETLSDVLQSADAQLNRAIDKLVHLTVDCSDYVLALEEAAAQLSRLKASSFAEANKRCVMSAALPSLASKVATVERLLDSAAALYFGYSGDCIQAAFGYTVDGAVESAQARASMQLEA